MRKKDPRYQPKEENRLFATRLKEALRRADMSQSDLARLLAERGIYSRGSKSAVSNWARGVHQPDNEHMPAIAAALGVSMAWFSDPQYSKDYWRVGIRHVARLLDDVLMHGGSIVEEAERRSGDPRLLDHAERQRLAANQRVLLDYLRRKAPAAWEAMDERQRLDLIEALLMEGSPFLEPDSRSEGGVKA